MAGETDDDNIAEDVETYTVSLCDGEHIQKLDLCSSWFIEKVKLTTNLGKVFGPWGVELGGEERRPHRHIRSHTDTFYLPYDRTVRFNYNICFKPYIILGKVSTRSTCTWTACGATWCGPRAPRRSTESPSSGAS